VCPLAPAGCNVDFLGCSVCEYEPDGFVLLSTIQRVMVKMLLVLDPSRWHAAMAIYIVSFISYNTLEVLYVAVFPSLARNTHRTNRLRELYAAGKMTGEEYEIEESLEKNRISNISTVRSPRFMLQ